MKKQLRRLCVTVTNGARTERIKGALGVHKIKSQGVTLKRLKFLKIYLSGKKVIFQIIFN